MIMQAFSKWALCAALLVPPFAAAQGLGMISGHDDLSAAFRGWLGEHQFNGDLATGITGSGAGWDVVQSGSEVPELASISKSITAACITHLVEGGHLGWSDRLSDLLGLCPDVTIAGLITHSTGLGPDATQMAMPLWLGQGDGLQGHFAAQVLDLVNARAEQSGARGVYLYNNENYALLGLVIEAVSGRPHIEMGGGACYGLGTVFRAYGYGFWHFGALCFPGRLNTGSYAVLWEGRVSAAAFYDACLDRDAMAGLDRALFGAAYGRGQ